MTTKTPNPVLMHVSLYVTDIQQTVAFYTAFFGQSATKVMPGYAKFELQIPGLLISFVENPGKVQSQFGHLGFRVDSIEELTDRLNLARAAGLDLREEMDVSCCYAVQDKFWATDPDGYQWEVYLFKEDAQFNDPHYATDAASACCIAPAANDVSTQVSTSTATPLVMPAQFRVKPKATAEACAPGGNCC